MSKQPKNPIKARGNMLHFDFKFKGRTVRQTTGCEVGEEELAYQKYLALIDDLEKEIKGIPLNRSIDDGLIWYLETKVPKDSEPKKLKSHVKIIREYYDSRKENEHELMPIRRIYEIANDYLSDMLQEGRLKHSTINRRTTILRQIATHAYTKKNPWLDEPPFKKIPVLSEKHLRRKTHIKQEDVLLLAENCEMDITCELSFFAAYTGLRTAEIWRLNEGSLKGNILHVDGKGGRKRGIPLNDPRLVEFVEEYIPIQLPEWRIKEDFYNARYKTDLLEYVFHDLRHTFGTIMAKDGRSQAKIMAAMGHETAEMTNQYLDLKPEDLIEDMPAIPKSHKKVHKIKAPKLKVVS